MSISLARCLPQCGKSRHNYESIPVATPPVPISVPLESGGVLLPSRLKDPTCLEKFWMFILPLQGKLDSLQGKLRAQNLQQRLGVLLSIPNEVFKAFSASFLLLSVPQVCSNGEICSFTSNFRENFSSRSNLYMLSLGFNLLTLLGLLILYVIEVRRENLLILYLEVNPKLPFDVQSVDERLGERLDPRHRQSIREMDALYGRICSAANSCYYTNIAVTLVCLWNDNALTVQSVSSLYAWVALMKARLDFALSISNSSLSSALYHSAYLHLPLQFNDVDPEWALDDQLAL